MFRWPHRLPLGSTGCQANAHSACQAQHSLVNIFWWPCSLSQLTFPVSMGLVSKSIGQGGSSPLSPRWDVLAAGRDFSCLCPQMAEVWSVDLCRAPSSTSVCSSQRQPPFSWKMTISQKSKPEHPISRISSFL